MERVGTRGSGEAKCGALEVGSAEVRWSNWFGFGKSQLGGASET